MLDIFMVLCMHCQITQFLSLLAHCFVSYFFATLIAKVSCYFTLKIQGYSGSQTFVHFTHFLFHGFVPALLPLVGKGLQGPTTVLRVTAVLSKSCSDMAGLSPHLCSASGGKTVRLSAGAVALLDFRTLGRFYFEWFRNPHPLYIQIYIDFPAYLGFYFCFSFLRFLNSHKDWPELIFLPQSPKY